MNILQRNDKANTNYYNIIFIGGNKIKKKTSLIERLINNKFIENFSPTVGVFYRFKKVRLKNGKIIVLVLHDTCGQEYFISTIPIQYIKDSACIILGFDAQDTFLEMKNLWYPYVKKFLNGQLIYLIRNKIDLVQDREAEGKEARNFAEENKFRYFEMSCKTGEGVQKFFDDLITQITKTYI